MGLNAVRSKNREAVCSRPIGYTMLFMEKTR